MVTLLGILLALAGSSAVEVDAGKVIGKIRSFQGVNCGPAPLVAGKAADVTRQYKDLRVDLVRTHDFFGPTDVDARWPADPDPISRRVEASGDKAIFRDWNADPEDERSYNFGPSDQIIKAIVDSGAEVYYRVGRSWGADPTPPPDFDRFASVTRHIAMHYNAGWARGFHYNIRYWEIWNEPDVKRAWDPSYIQPFWTGTPQQYFTLYEKVARALKAFDPKLKVGGSTMANGAQEGPYRRGFISYCAERKVPLDFYSWHLYHTPPTDASLMVGIGATVRRVLDAAGYTQAESVVSEWNLSRSNAERARPGSMEMGIFPAAAIIHLQDAAIDHTLYYRGDATGRLFSTRGEYLKPAYALKATAMMLETPERLGVVAGGDGPLVLAGRAAGGGKVQVLVCNFRREGGYSLRVKNLPWAKCRVKRYRLTETEDLAPGTETVAEGGRFEASGELPSFGLELFVLEP
jgi:hypothetical protein